MTPDERAALIQQISGMKVPLTQLDPTAPDGHDDTDASALQAIKGLSEQDDTEQAGLIIQGTDGKYRYTLPVTQKQHDHFLLSYTPNKGEKVAGIFHTHPGKDAAGQVFSPQDLQVADHFNVPSYVLFQSAGQVRKYVPGQTKKSLYSPSGAPLDMQHVARGDLVQVPPTDANPPS